MYRYDLLFGLTEMESYHALNAVGLSHGLLASERDAYLRDYMQNRYELRADVALALTLQEYMDIYSNPERQLPEEHRDTVNIYHISYIYVQNILYTRAHWRYRKYI